MLRISCVMVLITLSLSCAEDCRIDLDCNAQEVWQTCVEGQCVTKEESAKKACPDNDPNQCDAARVCLDEVCEFAPTCQRFQTETLAVRARCDDLPDTQNIQGSVVVPQDDCENRVAFLGRRIFDFEINSLLARGDIDVPACASASFDSARGALVANDCTFDQGPCESVAIALRPNAIPCFVDADCDGACEVIEGIGVCQ